MTAGGTAATDMGSSRTPPDLSILVVPGYARRISPAVAGVKPQRSRYNGPKIIGEVDVQPPVLRSDARGASLSHQTLTHAIDPRLGADDDVL